MNLLSAWFKRTFSDPQTLFLALALVVGFGVVLLAGQMLAPVLASIVIAYLLEGLVSWLERRGSMRILAVLLVYLSFLTLVVLIVFGLLPQITRQASQLIGQLPSMLASGREALMALPERYPDFVDAGQIEGMIEAIRAEVGRWGQEMLSVSLESVIGLITLLVYVILVPLLVFFFLKDKQQISAWFRQLLPNNRRLASRVWQDVDRQIGNYVRGKVIEVLIVWAVCVITFSAFGLQYAMLLGLLVGLSVIIPYVGAAVVTIPVMMVAWFQWGATPDFWYVTVAYLVIQALDGNVLVPLLFSEVVNLHPVAIIVAIVVFGGLWGFWGVFFAIPLATLVQAVLTAWPRLDTEEPAQVSL